MQYFCLCNQAEVPIQLSFLLLRSKIYVDNDYLEHGVNVNWKCLSNSTSLTQKIFKLCIILVYRLAKPWLGLNLMYIWRHTVLDYYMKCKPFACLMSCW